MHACDYLLTVDLDMEPLPGYPRASWDRGYGDHHNRPHWATARRLPWLEGTALVLGDVCHEGGGAVEVAPRQVLRRQIERAAAHGLKPMLAAELEAYIFRDSFAQAHAADFRELTPFSNHLEDYVLLQATREEPLLRTIRNRMEEAGIPIEGTKGEWGKGQVEFNLQYADALTMADRHVIFKHGATEIADSLGHAITFMPKPDASAAGSSCHIHTSLWDQAGERNRFWEPAGDYGHGRPSATFERFLAGQLALARELSLCFAPFVNSYKRYQSLSWAPTVVAWSWDNRTCGFRVVGHGNACRIENRIPGSDANPYLAFAAVIAAGLYGLEHELPLPAATNGNVYAASGASVVTVPTSLHEAIDLWARSEIVPEILGEAVHQHYLTTARHELAAFERAVTDWERRRYFERV
jgi:glutamine synthetase